MRLVFFFIFIALSCSAQNNPITIKIDSITSKDSSEFQDREFTISYHIENQTANEISFFLNTNSFMPNAYSSMGFATTYKLFQNENQVDAVRIITNKRTNSFSDRNNNKSVINFIRVNHDSIQLEIKKHKMDSLYFFQKKNKAILSAIFTLKPKETKVFTQTLYWNKERYTKNEDLEYYFDEDSHYYLELELTLLKNEYRDRLTQKELEAIVNNPNFIKGYFYSNKVAMNFKE